MYTVYLLIIATSTIFHPLLHHTTILLTQLPKTIHPAAKIIVCRRRNKTNLCEREKRGYRPFTKPCYCSIHMYILFSTMKSYYDTTKAFFSLFFSFAAEALKPGVSVSLFTPIMQQTLKRKTTCWCHYHHQRSAY